MRSKAVHPEKAFPSMSLSPFGKMTSFKRGQPAKALSPMSSNPSEKTTSSSASISLKTSFLILFHGAGEDNALDFVHVPRSVSPPYGLDIVVISQCAIAYGIIHSAMDFQGSDLWGFLLIWVRIFVDNIRVRYFYKYMDSYDIISLLHTLFCVKGTINKQAPLQTLDLSRGACYNCYYSESVENQWIQSIPSMTYSVTSRTRRTAQPPLRRTSPNVGPMQYMYLSATSQASTECASIFIPQTYLLLSHAVEVQ